MTTTEKVQRAIKYSLYIAIVLCGGLYLTAYVGAEFGADWALSIKSYIETRWNVVLGAGTATAMLMVTKFASTIANSTSLSLNKTSKVTELFNVFLGKAETLFTGLKDGIAQLFDGMKEFKTIIATVTELAKDMGGIKATVDGLSESIKFIYDINMLQLAKTESDEYLSSIKVAAMKPQLVERAAKVRELLSDSTISEAERAEAMRVVVSARDVIKANLEEARKEVAAEKKVIEKKRAF
jgi:hypothetical protein